MGRWQPSARFFGELVSADTTAEDVSRPYPFFLASPLETGPDQLGDPEDWLTEWKWDGIRAQLVRRAGKCFLWSRGEDLVTDRFPEVGEAASWLPDGTVLDGELLPWNDEGVMGFADLQKRLGRKRIPADLLNEVPVRFMAYDILENRGRDVRALALSERRAMMERRLLSAPGALRVSPVLEEDDWARLADLRMEARSRGVEGLVVKRRDSAYRAGRRRGDWWKWKVDPYTVDAVMIYAQPGHGRRSSLYTDYTFGVWRGRDLVPIAKAYSGLSNKEIRRLDRWIRANTVERFGPVRSVRPEQVFELAFEGINPSSRHKSGVALRFPRIHRWREDLSPGGADRLSDLKRLISDGAG
jgi:DNA ligase-1